MTWNAYNRRKEVLHEVLAIADRRREGITAAALLAEVSDPAFTSEDELLHAAQMVWAQALSSHIERTAFLGDGTLESSVIDAWHVVAAEHPGLRALLDGAVDMAEMHDAFAKEHQLLARATGVATNHPDLEGLGRRVKETAVATTLEVPALTDTPAGIFGRLREALAA